MADFPRILQAGDSALLVAFGEALTEPVNHASHAFDRAIGEADWEGVTETVPGIRGVLVRHDPLQLPAETLTKKLDSLLTSEDWYEAGPVAGRRRWKLPAWYGGEAGPELEQVADTLGLSVEDTVREHADSPTSILMLGFSPGCAYIGSLPERWDLPRLDYVKPEVPPGSLSVAIRQTVLFATPIPTGWQTIARTPFRSFTRSQEPWFHLAAGDEITFDPIDATTFDEMARAVAAGERIVEPEILS